MFVCVFVLKDVIYPGGERGWIRKALSHLEVGEKSLESL